jgi:acyl carrier protein
MRRISDVHDGDVAPRHSDFTIAAGAALSVLDSLSSRLLVFFDGPRRNSGIIWATRRMEYMGMSVRSTITSVFERVVREQRRPHVPLTDDLKLVGSSLDSLSFAIIVVSLEDELGFDPFNSDEVEFPVTFGDFVHLYEARPA